jgi:flagellar basal-body rod protein FlgF/flagellar basal-body rod protein FlgG
MDSGFYAACTALMARSQTLDMVANNLANVSTPGYRAQHDSFRSLLATSSNMSLSGLNQAVNDYSVLGGGELDLSQGNLEKTGNDLDLAIQGKGFFAIQTAGGQVYTRDGNFHTDANGHLVTSQGDAVLGNDDRPIPIIGTPVSVSPDGSISVNGALAGQLKLVDFPTGTSLQSVGKNYYSTPVKSAVPATDASIQQGMLEGSNVNAVASSVELITVQRYAELMQRALTMFHTEMNQIATQDLPKVSTNF